MQRKNKNLVLTGVSKKERIEIITSQFNDSITQKLEKACIKTLKKNGLHDYQITTHRVPGALEIPIVAKLIAKTKKPDVIIALGCVIRGDTFHFEVVVENSSRGCLDVSLQTGVPIINEILACNDPKQARVRSANNRHNKGIEAAHAALEIIETISKI